MRNRFPGPVYEASGTAGGQAAPPATPPAQGAGGGNSPGEAPAPDLTTPQAPLDLTAPPPAGGAPAAPQGSQAPGQEKPAGTPPVNEFIGAPETDYEPVTLPDGIAMDGEVFDSFKPIAKELGLSQKGVQKLAEYKVQMDQANTRKWNEHVSELRQKAATDPEIGGAQYAATLQTAHRAIGAFGDDDFKQMLVQYGVGAHPAMIKFCQRVGAAIGEVPATTDAGGSGKANVPLYEILYKDHK